MAYSTIPKGSLYMNTKLYTGNGGTQSITGVGFQPDWSWIKNRDATDWHFLTDAVRGVTKTLHSNTTNAESTQATALTAFGSDGFTVGSDGSVNRNNENFVSWNWKANGQGSANTDGSINTTYTSVNTTAGFSISKYTGNATNGATVGHGLGAVPDMLIGKDLSDTSGWGVWHKDLTNAGYKLSLNTTDGQADDSALFGGSSRTAPTSSVFTLGSGGGLNGSNANIVYAFTSIKGYSNFGSYVGNGNVDGTFIYTGFKPSFIMYKKSTGTGRWTMEDNKRDPFNVATHGLEANGSSVENTGSNYWDVDLLSNGFKLRTTEQETNQSGQTFIYMAFAKNPFVATSGSTGVPVTAR